MRAWRQAMDCNRAVHVELQAYRAQTSKGREPARTDDPEDAGSSSILYGMLSIMGVAKALAEHEANRSRIGDDSHNSGTGGRRQVSTIRECTYTDFLKCQPLNFKGTEGVVGLTQWFEKMESVFHISNCKVACQIKFATCTLQGNALTWWNSHPFKRHNVARAYTAGPREKKLYGGSKPLCPKCIYHHDGQCAPKCANCKRTGHLTRDGKSPAVAANNKQRAPRANQRVLTCFECGAQGHFKSNCLKLKNRNQGNQAGNGNAIARAYAVGTIGTNPNSNVVMGTFLLNNRYASILFDTDADRSFVSTTFSSLIDIIPTTPTKE
ncbi:putative reverse transcriptase domain-containing protein [Tanacetum coccineum]